MPIGVAIPEEFDLPVALPLLDLLLAPDRFADVRVHLEPHQLVDAIPGRKPANFLGLVLPDATREVVGDADVKRTVAAGGEDVDEVVLEHCATPVHVLYDTAN